MTMPGLRCEWSQALPLLERTPRVVRGLLGGLPDEWVLPGYGPGTWGAKEIVAHLVFCERTDWVPRMRVIVEHGNRRAFDPFDRAGHAPLLTMHGLAELLDVFERERIGTLAAAAAMCADPASMSRIGRHPALGEVTVGNLLAAWVIHDLNHIAQISKALAFQWKPHVGPWEAYLSILSPPNPR